MVLKPADLDSREDQHMTAVNRKTIKTLEQGNINGCTNFRMPRRLH